MYNHVSAQVRRQPQRSPTAAAVPVECRGLVVYLLVRQPVRVGRSCETVHASVAELSLDELVNGPQLCVV
jgi:hypothetical protein